MNIHIHVNIYICVYLHMCTHTYIWICIYVYIYIYIHVHVYIRTINMYSYTHLHMYPHTCITNTCIMQFFLLCWQIHACIRAYSFVNINISSYLNIHTHTHSRAHTHTHRCLKRSTHVLESKSRLLTPQIHQAWERRYATILFSYTLSLLPTPRYIYVYNFICILYFSTLFWHMILRGRERGDMQQRCAHIPAVPCQPHGLFDISYVD